MVLAAVLLSPPSPRSPAGARWWQGWPPWGRKPLGRPLLAPACVRFRALPAVAGRMCHLTARRMQRIKHPALGVLSVFSSWFATPAASPAPGRWCSETWGVFPSRPLWPYALGLGAHSALVRMAGGAGGDSDTLQGKPLHL